MMENNEVCKLQRNDWRGNNGEIINEKQEEF